MKYEIIRHSGGAITRKFASLEDLQEWAKNNIDNPAVLQEVLKPIAKSKSENSAIEPAEVDKLHEAV